MSHIQIGGYEPHVYSGMSYIKATDGLHIDEPACKLSFASDISIICPRSSKGAREIGSLDRLGGRQEMDVFMPAPMACQTEVDQAGKRGG
jgi:hypothetical protein